MLQLIQNYRTGEIELADVPVPRCSTNTILVKNEASLISIGTERSIIELGKKSLLGKARARPDLVKRFLDKAKKEGFLKTFQEALGRLDNPTTLGYSSAGIVIEVGSNVHKFSAGDRVACIGAGYASHSEYITVPENLCAKLPEDVSFEEGAFGMLGCIAMHGVRCANLTFGERVAVIGLGLLGLLTVQILFAYGCEVIGFDIEEQKANLARDIGLRFAYTNIEGFKNAIDKMTNGHGTDGVIITAATKSDEPINVAVDIARKRAKIVMVGVGDIHPNRNEMWHKEVEIVVSKAGGPGIFDPLYENKGIDYPIEYVRWTENRNLEEFLRLVSLKRIDLTSLISHRVQISDSLSVYNDLLKDSRKYIGVVIQYPELKGSMPVLERTKVLCDVGIHSTKRAEKVVAGVIGAGLFGKALLLPTMTKNKDLILHSLSTSSSANVYHTGKKYKFQVITTDYQEILKNNEINSVVILTPHSLHKKMVIESLQAGKHVFVEKPLCISEEELREIDDVYRSSEQKPYLMVGYNRRFSPHSKRVLEFIGVNKDSEFKTEGIQRFRFNPLVVHYRVNAGFVTPDHWVHSEEEGGSRVIGEICHFLDWMIYITQSRPTKIFAQRVSGDNKSIVNSDNLCITIKFGDGSVGSIVYSASGDKAFSREYIEVFCEGKTAVIRDFRETQLLFNGRKKTFKTLNQEMGYQDEFQNFSDVILGKSEKGISYKEIYWSTLGVFKINESLASGTTIVI
ncbi:MAG TPA: bi-domain-containing oxidoreductase [Syntrophorhabdaceae bacterium]|nr:bi-domain-containing oxidoreductase [Syntrophorhabdaceae bacterium]